MDSNKLHSEIEHLIIEWNLEARRTAGSLTREIMDLIKKDEEAIIELMISASKWGSWAYDLEERRAQGKLNLEDFKEWRKKVMRDLYEKKLKSKEEKVMNEQEIIKAQQELINLLYTQVVDLSMMSKIELGDDVIAEIKRLRAIINEHSR